MFACSSAQGYAGIDSTTIEGCCVETIPDNFLKGFLIVSGLMVMGALAWYAFGPSDANLLHSCLFMSLLVCLFQRRAQDQRTQTDTKASAQKPLTSRKSTDDKLLLLQNQLLLQSYQCHNDTSLPPSAYPWVISNRVPSQ